MKPTERLKTRITSLEDINYRISSFINTFTMVLFIAMLMAVAGLLMKILEMNGGSYVFIFSIIVLMLMFLVQIGLSFFYIVSHVKLALLGAFGSLALALSFLAVLFRFQGWPGWQIMYLISLPIFLITAFFLGRYLNHHEKLHHNQSRFLYRNLLFPYVLAFVLAVSSFVIDINKPESRNIILENAPATQADSAGKW
ncbi:MAG TPA: hypothetical protein VK927_12045 [Adhaeribacter sp.]|nr:hypothetical protein [Adhaeribacter sp.]